ncbi:hypothetical protein ABFS82_05G052000 [Erythranthe guttata]
MDRISELPQEILQQILYFLSQEDYATFKGSKQEFLSLVDKNLQRHCDQRVRIEEFGLCISLDESDRESVSRLENWIRALTNMGTKKFCLSIRSELEHGSGFFHLHSVVFEVAESLQDLRVKILTSDQKSYKRTILSKHLKELHLQNVYINDKDFQRIISSCPLVETASLESCKGLQNIKVNNSLRNLKKFSFYKMPSTEDERCSIEIHPPSSIQTIDIDNGDLKFHKGADFRNLEYLYLRRVTTSSDQLSWCKFPSLQLLDIDCCNGLKELRIFIDAPRIRKFYYWGDFIPSISFATTTPGRRYSNIRVWYMHSDDATTWFFKLNELLKSLSQFVISLSIYQYSTNDGDVIRGNVNLLQGINGCNKPVAVESLCLDCHLFSFSSLLNGAFSICRPRIIDTLFFRGKMDHIECVWKILSERESGGEDDDQLRRLWLQDLEEVVIEVYKNREGWHPITPSDLPNYQETEFNGLRFVLKWRELR